MNGTGIVVAGLAVVGWFAWHPLVLRFWRRGSLGLTAATILVLAKYPLFVTLFAVATSGSPPLVALVLMASLIAPVVMYRSSREVLGDLSRSWNATSEVPRFTQETLLWEDGGDDRGLAASGVRKQPPDLSGTGSAARAEPQGKRSIPGPRA